MDEWISGIERKNAEKWHTYLRMSFFCCTFAAFGIFDIVDLPQKERFFADLCEIICVCQFFVVIFHFVFSSLFIVLFIVLKKFFCLVGEYDFFCVALPRKAEKRAALLHQDKVIISITCPEHSGVPEEHIISSQEFNSVIAFDQHIEL